MKQSLIVVMPVGREHVNMDFFFKNTINESMLLGDFSAPSPFWLSFQWLRMPKSCLGMVIKFPNEPHGLLVSLRLITKEFFRSA